MKALLTTAALTAAALPGAAAPEAGVLDPSHGQILFSYDQLGYSTTWGMFSGFEGEITFDRENPATSSVTASFPVRSAFGQGAFAPFVGDAAELQIPVETTNAE